MLRIILIVCLAGASVSVPLLHEAFPDALRRLFNPREAPEPVVLAAPPPRVQPEQSAARAEILSGRKVRLEADASGHFRGEFRLNGRMVEGMIDTGATLVAINLATARRIGITVAPGDFRHEVATANGKAKAAMAIIDRLAIGRIEVRDVSALVLDDRGLDGMLVGISFLGRLSRYQVEDGSMLLVQ